MGKDIQNAPSHVEAVDVGVEKVLASNDVDEAFKFLKENAVEDGFDDIDEKKLMRKVDWMMMVWKHQRFHSSC